MELLRFEKNIKIIESNCITNMFHDFNYIIIFQLHSVFQLLMFVAHATCPGVDVLPLAYWCATSLGRSPSHTFEVQNSPVENRMDSLIIHCPFSWLPTAPLILVSYPNLHSSTITEAGAYSCSVYVYVCLPPYVSVPENLDSLQPKLLSTIQQGDKGLKINWVSTSFMNVSV